MADATTGPARGTPPPAAVPGEPGSSLVIFDVDGTLVDSQDGIVAAMAGAFASAGLGCPPRAAVLSIVGLSLPEAMAVLLPGGAAHERARLVELYKQSFVALRRRGAGESEAPLFPGAAAALGRLTAAGHLLSIATGKARRGLDHMLDSHGLRHHFLATQTADDAPSKPAPGMVLNCLAATGAAAARTAVVGDTEFDMAMARAAGVRALGVAWGYHGADRLRRGGAELIVEDFADLDRALAALGVVS